MATKKVEAQKTVIVVRKDLELPMGKWVAQAVHAALRAVTNEARSMMALSEIYEHYPAPICIVCYVKNETKLLNLTEKVKKARLPYGLQRDAGHNFVEAGTPTVLCIGPASESEINEVTKRLQLLK